MKTSASSLAILLLLSAPTLAAQNKAMPASGEAVTMNPGDLKWGDAPPELPKGAKLAVLHGDPSRNAVFTVRIRMPDGYKIPPHWHTRDEQLTIVSGTFLLHMGDAMTSPAHELAAGGYHFLPGKTHHAAEARGEVVVQVDGTGPFDIHYLNAADQPKHASTSAK